jgi:hypothetical protein
LDLVESDDFGGKNFPCGSFHKIDGPGWIVGLFQYEFERRHDIKDQGLEQEFLKQNFVWLLLFVSFSPFGKPQSPLRTPGRVIFPSQFPS